MVEHLPLSEMLKGLFVLLSTIRLRLVPLLNVSRRTCIESACSWTVSVTEEMNSSKVEVVCVRGSWFASFAVVVESLSAAQCG